MSALIRPCGRARTPASRCVERVDEQVELVEDDLEPELARLVHDDEQQLVGVLGSERGRCSCEQLVEREVRSVGDLGRRQRRVAQKVATSSAATSSTRIISVVKNGSP